ncbi:Hypothetical protein GLP15_4936 [Giardia lamblia P15]|uniref:Uncharacterized protein n=1 Tax=Giardia intestinalis (strain P15) TaxID=658858 RepID=E1F0V9_GIAIA|nr:Hypothetical protein GLP15_4936 [Giardia lamblia P15]
MADRTAVLSSVIKWISVGACTAGALASASLLFQGLYVGDFLLHLVLSTWLILMGLADFSLEPANTLNAKYISETGRTPGKRGVCMIIISFMLPCYTTWTQLMTPVTTLFILTKVLWIILLTGGTLVMILGLVLHFCA